MLHRSLANWEWYQDNNVKSVFLDLLLSVNHKPKKWQGVLVERGQVITSLGKISGRTGLSIKSVRLALDKLEKTQEIGKQTTNRYSIITIRNFDEYQKDDREKKPITGKQTASNGQASGNQRATNNNDNNEKNDNKYIPLENFPDLKITQEQATRLKAKYQDNGLSLADGLQKLQTYARTDTRKFKKYKDHNLVLQGWVLDACIKSKSNKLNLERQEMLHEQTLRRVKA